jgi:hypothetical protein
MICQNYHHHRYMYHHVSPKRKIGLRLSDNLYHYVFFCSVVSIYTLNRYHQNYDNMITNIVLRTMAILQITSPLNLGKL